MTPKNSAKASIFTYFNLINTFCKWYYEILNCHKSNLLELVFSQQIVSVLHFGTEA